MKKKLLLSDIEWSIMEILWEKGVLSVKEVITALYPNGEKAYTTVQTFMDRMVEKKLLRKEKIGLVNFYQPIVEKKHLMKKETESLVSKAFNGSFGSLAAFLVDSYNIDTDDLKKIKQLIEEKEKEE